MSQSNKKYYRYFGPNERKEHDDAIQEFLNNGGKVTKLKPAEGTTDYAFKKMNRNGINKNDGKTGGVALFDRVERSTLEEEE